MHIKRLTQIPSTLLIFVGGRVINLFSLLFSISSFSTISTFSLVTGNTVGQIWRDVLLFLRNWQNKVMLKQKEPLWQFGFWCSHCWHCWEGGVAVYRRMMGSGEMAQWGKHRLCVQHWDSQHPSESLLVWWSSWHHTDVQQTQLSSGSQWPAVFTLPEGALDFSLFSLCYVLEGSWVV